MAVVADLDLVVELDAVFDDGVGQRAAVDRGVGADVDVVAHQHAPGLRDLDVDAVLAAKPKPSVPITAPECRMPRAPMMQRAWKVTLANRWVPSPISAARPTKQPASITAPADHGAASMVTCGPMWAVGSTSADSCTTALAWMPGGRHDIAQRHEILRGAREIGVGLVVTMRAPS
jgi:hypothetical protein